MSDSNEKSRARKREWARRKAQERRESGKPSYTTEWREKNPEAYEGQKERAKERRAVARAVAEQ